MENIKFDNLVQIRKKKVVRDFPSIMKPVRPICKDLYGPTRTKRLHGDYYFILFVDDFTRKTWVSFLKRKWEAFSKFKAFKELVENETDVKIKCIWLDNGGEFTSNEFGSFYEESVIKRQFSIVRTPQ